MILYLDTSALVKLLIEEEGSPEAERAVVESRVLASSRLSYVETYAALARARAAQRLSAADHRDKRREFEKLWRRLLALEIDEPVVATAAGFAERHLLRANDAIQLASASSLGEAEEVVFACWDRELRAAAGAERLELVPRQRG